MVAKKLGVIKGEVLLKAGIGRLPKAKEIDAVIEALLDDSAKNHAEEKFSVLFNRHAQWARDPADNALNDISVNDVNLDGDVALWCGFQYFSDGTFVKGRHEILNDLRDFFKPAELDNRGVFNNNDDADRYFFQQMIAKYWQKDQLKQIAEVQNKIKNGIAVDDADRMYLMETIRQMKKSNHEFANYDVLMEALGDKANHQNIAEAFAKISAGIIEWKENQARQAEIAQSSASAETFPKRLLLSQLKKIDDSGYDLPTIMGQVDSTNSTVAQQGKNGLIYKTYSGFAAFEILQKQIEHVSEKIINDVNSEDDEVSDKARKFSAATLIKIDNFPDASGKPSNVSRVALVHSSARGAGITFLPAGFEAELESKQDFFYKNRLAEKFLETKYSGLGKVKKVAQDVLLELLKNRQITQNDMDRLIGLVDGGTIDSIETLFSHLTFAQKNALFDSLGDLESKVTIQERQGVRESAMRDMTDYLSLEVERSVADNRKLLELSQKDVDEVLDAAAKRDLAISDGLLEAPMPQSPFNSGVSFLRNNLENTVTVVFGDKGDDIAWIHIKGTDCYVRARRYDGGSFTVYENGIARECSAEYEVGDVVIDYGTVFRITRDGEYQPLAVDDPNQNLLPGEIAIPWLGSVFPAAHDAILTCYEQMGVKAMSLVNGERAMAVLENGDVMNVGKLTRRVSKADEKTDISYEEIEKEGYQTVSTGINIYGVDDETGARVAKAKVVLVVLGDRDRGFVVEKNPYLVITDEDGEVTYKSLSDQALQDLGCTSDDIERFEEKYEKFLDANPTITFVVDREKHADDVYQNLYGTAELDYPSNRVVPVEFTHINSGRELVNPAYASSIEDFGGKRKNIQVNPVMAR